MFKIKKYTTMNGNNLIYRLCFLFFISTLFFACKKDDADKATIDVVFSNVFNGSPFVDGKYYVTANGDSTTVEVFKYYISNISFASADGSLYKEPNSYHLIDAFESESLKFSMPNVPASEYNSISFLIGVDSIRNVSGAQNGALDPEFGMFWTWNSGYIMAKFEGKSPQSPELDKTVMFHVGGFSGNFNTVKSVTIALPSTMNLSSKKTSVIELQADAAEWFKNPITLNLANDYIVHSAGADAKKVADNYANMITVKAVK
jgi:hypothetical protein